VLLFVCVFDDIMQFSEVQSRKEVSLKTRLTKNITLNNPIVSSNMDTVTEAEMAIAMARNGGIGIIHRFVSIEDQVKMVVKVKREESFKIENPYTCSPDTTVDHLLEMMEEKGVKGFLVTVNNKLEGIVTTRDIRFADKKLLVKDVMTKREKLVVGPTDVSLSEAQKIIAQYRLEKLPLVDGENNLRGLITSTDLINFTRRAYATLDVKGQLRVGAAVGVKDSEGLEGGYLDRARALVAAGVDVLVVDIAHGHSSLAINATKTLKSVFPNMEVIAGNVATADGARDLIAAGAYAIKVGVGPGSICITRIVTGCGVPQLTALLDCVSEARKHGIPVIADGGMQNSGDVMKALAAGADTVMLGSALAGTDESPGKPLVKDGKKVKVIRGMAGYGASMSRRQKQGVSDDVFDIIPEGVEAIVPYRGPLAGIIRQLVGGICSGLSYCGSLTVPELHQKAEFIMITGAGKKESGSHDVTLI